MAKKNINIFYPFKKGSDKTDLNASIKLIKREYPDATIHIDDQDYSTIRGVDVAHKVINYARENKGRFLYMNDDFLVVKQPHKAMYSGELKVNPKHPISYQVASQNTIDFLNSCNKPLKNFETHSPVWFDCEKVIELFDQITWKNDNFFIKSLYLNYYELIGFEGANVKIHQTNVALAQSHLKKYGCVSLGDGFDINSLKSLLEL
jgi:hypothetical protein